MPVHLYDAEARPCYDVSRNYDLVLGRYVQSERRPWGYGARCGGTRYFFEEKRTPEG